MASGGVREFFAAIPVNRFLGFELILSEELFTYLFRKRLGSTGC